MKNNETHLKFFGIGSVLPYLGHVKGQIIIMLTAAFLGSKTMKTAWDSIHS